MYWSALSRRRAYILCPSIRDAARNFSALLSKIPRLSKPFFSTLAHFHMNILLSNHFLIIFPYNWISLSINFRMIIANFVILRSKLDWSQRYRRTATAPRSFVENRIFSLFLQIIRIFFAVSFNNKRLNFASKCLDRKSLHCIYLRLCSKYNFYTEIKRKSKLKFVYREFSRISYRLIANIRLSFKTTNVNYTTVKTFKYFVRKNPFNRSQI